MVPPLSQTVPPSHFSNLALKCLQTLVTPSDVTDELSATLAHVPLRTTWQRDNHVGIIADMLDKMNVVRRYTPVRQPRVPRGGCWSLCPSGAAGCARKVGGGGRERALRQGVITVDSDESAPELVVFAKSFDAHVLLGSESDHGGGGGRGGLLLFSVLWPAGQPA